MELRKWLDKSGMSAAAFGRKIKVSRAAIVRYADKLRCPKEDVARRIIAETGGEVTLEDLFYGVERPKPTKPRKARRK